MILMFFSFFSEYSTYHWLILVENVSKTRRFVKFQVLKLSREWIFQVETANALEKMSKQKLQ